MGRLAITIGTTLLLFAAPVHGEVPDSKPVVVPFDLLVTKHMVVMIKINGKGPYRVIFDTGAPVTLVNTKIAKDSGLVSKNAARPLFGLMAAGDLKIKTLEIGALKANDVPVIVMDHPTVELAAKFLGPIEGIVGFPLFARYRMTLDYQAKQMTFVPNGYDPPDVLQSLMKSLMAAGQERPAVKVLAPAALWGLVVSKDAGDEEAGVTLKQVLPGGAAAKAGLQAGDRLLTLDGRWTDTVNDCYAAAAAARPGIEVIVVVKRNGAEVRLRVKPMLGL